MKEVDANWWLSHARVRPSWSVSRGVNQVRIHACGAAVRTQCGCMPHAR